MNLLTLVENSSIAYMIYNICTNEILDGNKIAKNLYANQECFPLLSDIFEENAIDNIQLSLKTKKFYKSLDLIYFKNAKKSHICNVEITKIPKYKNLFCISVEEDRKTSDLIQENKEQQAFLNLSEDVFLKLDITNKKLHLKFKSDDYPHLPCVIENFPQSIKDIIHKNDLKDFLIFTMDLMQGICGSHEMRLNLKNDCYERFKITVTNFEKCNDKAFLVGKLQNIQKITQLAKQSTIDQLTTTFNKNAFEENVVQILKNTNSSTSHALVFVDLDDFKKINDTYGHFFGDFLLKNVGKRLKRAVRSHDLVGRVGGDEFVVFFKAFENEKSVLDRTNLLLEILSHEFYQNENFAKINASIGVAFFPKHGTTYDELYKNADKALYLSKENGKNIVSIYK